MPTKRRPARRVFSHAQRDRGSTTGIRRQSHNRLASARARLRLSVTTTGALGLLLAATVILTSCNAEEPKRSRPDANKPAGRPLFGGSVEPGTRYQTRVFQPALTFAMPDGDWFARVTDYKTLLVLEGTRHPDRPGSRPPRPLFLALQRYARVYNPDGPRGVASSVGPAPADLVGWLRAHPDLSPGRVTSVVVAGARGRQFDAVVTMSKPRHTSPECAQFRCVALAPQVTFPRGFKVRFIVLEVKGPPTVVTIEAFPRDFSRFLPRAERVLRAVRFVPGR